MAKKAKYNIVCGGDTFEQGKVYDDAQVAHLDPNDFEDAEAVAETVADAPKDEVVADENADTEKKEVSSSDTQETSTDDVVESEDGSEVLEKSNKHVSNIICNHNKRESKISAEHH